MTTFSEPLLFLITFSIKKCKNNGGYTWIKLPWVVGIKGNFCIIEIKLKGKKLHVSAFSHSTKRTKFWKLSVKLKFFADTSAVSGKFSKYLIYSFSAGRCGWVI